MWQQQSGPRLRWLTNELHADRAVVYRILLAQMYTVHTNGCIYIYSAARLAPSERCNKRELLWFGASHFVLCSKPLSKLQTQKWLSNSNLQRRLPGLTFAPSPDFHGDIALVLETCSWSPFGEYFNSSDCSKCCDVDACRIKQPVLPTPRSGKLLLAVLKGAK